jgi:hypothetical protein
MESADIDPAPAEQTENLVAASGSYELLKKRLSAHGEALRNKAQG